MRLRDLKFYLDNLPTLALDATVIFRECGLEDDEPPTSHEITTVGIYVMPLNAYEDEIYVELQ